MPPPVRQHRGFTLIEIMIVVAIIGLIAAMGIPSILQAVRKGPLRQAVSDVVEACSHARAMAILQGLPTEVIIRAEDGQISVRQASAPTSGSSAPSSEAGFALSSPGVTSFSARLADTIAIQLLDVNFHDQMKADEALVQFFPNGTSDEFTIVLAGDDGGIRKITLDVITGLADTEVLR